jgi:hypothetical protein
MTPNSVCTYNIKDFIRTKHMQYSINVLISKYILTHTKQRKALGKRYYGPRGIRIFTIEIC